MTHSWNLVLMLRSWRLRLLFPPLPPVWVMLVGCDVFDSRFIFARRMFDTGNRVTSFGQAPIKALVFCRQTVFAWCCGCSSALDPVVV